MKTSLTVYTPNASRSDIDSLATLQWIERLEAEGNDVAVLAFDELRTIDPEAFAGLDPQDNYLIKVKVDFHAGIEELLAHAQGEKA